MLSSARAHSQTQMPHLDVYKGGEIVETIALSASKRRYTVGRQEGVADILLTHASISREQATITVSASGTVVVKDLGSAQGTYISGKRLDYSNETIEYLLDKLVMRMENRRRWTRALFRSSVVTQPAEDTCCICLEKYAANDAVIVLPCGHKFHDGELLEWLEKNSECPMCRQPVQDMKRIFG